MARLTANLALRLGLVTVAASLAVAARVGADGLRAGAFTAGGGTGSFGGTTFVGSFGQPVVGHDATLHSGLIVPILTGQPPVVDLNGQAAGNDYSTGFTEGTPALLEETARPP